MADPNPRLEPRINREGVFSNGISVVTVIRFIRAYDYEADRDAVAAYFGLEPTDVDAAIAFHSRNFEWVHPMVLEGER